MRIVLWTITALCTALAFAGCGDDEKSNGDLGADCNPDKSDSCGEDLVCSAAGDGNVCTYPAGGKCEPNNDDIDNGGCAENAVCRGPAADAGGEPTCLIKEGGECDPEEPYCDGKLVCAELKDGSNQCWGPVILRGDVTDTSDASPIADAQVIAINDEGVAVSDIAESDEDGNYDLSIPVVRNEDGSPVDATFTLRASAQDYQPFPSGIRVALPISTTEAEPEGTGYVIDNALTDIGLIPLEDAERYSISGKIVGYLADGGAAGEVGGVLVVVTAGGKSYSAVTDKSGNFTVFNVPGGSYEIKAYASDIQIEENTVDVDGDHVSGVELAELDDGTTTVSGNVNIVNAPGGSKTSVILVVEDTFDPNAARGEVPRGLRAPRTGDPNVTNDFSITGVPAGTYIVLAAYENDDLVRDPDTNIAGTGFVSVTVSAGQDEVTLSESFKVTEALATINPGVDEPEAVTSKPTLEWADDSSEDWYEVRVFDAFGDEVWNDLMVPSVSGGETVTLAYEGPLDVGMYYQFRVTSWRQPGGKDAAPISTTEDLRGVFFLPAE